MIGTLEIFFASKRWDAANFAGFFSPSEVRGGTWTPSSIFLRPGCMLSIRMAGMPRDYLFIPGRVLSLPWMGDQLGA